MDDPRDPMTASLQHRLSLWLSMFIMVFGVVAATASCFLALHDATESQDAQLDEVAGALSRQAFESVPPDRLPKDSEEAENRFVIAPLGVAAGTRNPRLNFVLPTTLADGLQTTTRNGKEWRVMVGRDSEGRRFAVAQTLSARNEDAVSSALFVLIPLALLIPALLVAVHVLLRRWFVPLHALSLQADRVDRSNFAALPDQDVASELQPFVQAVNRLLDRLGTAFDQQRRLVSDAAHELRSPVAALTVQADNIRALANTSELQERVTALRRGLDRMTQLIDQLLGLARMQETSHRKMQPIALDTVVRAAVESVLPLAKSKHVDLGCTLLHAVQIQGTQPDAYALVRNAIDNAVRYAPAGSAVDVSLEQKMSVAVFVVEDCGPGIDPDDLVRVFDPFVRVLGTRETGSGLGLSIAKGAADLMGGAIELGNREPPQCGLRFTYRQTIA